MKNILIFINVILLNIIIVNTSFQTSIFSETNLDNSGKNILISPLSIYQVLGLTTNGADGTTQKEMLSTIQAESLSELNSVNLQLIETIKKFTTVELANGVMTIFDPIKSFLKICDKYEAPVEKLVSLEQVNEWCDKKTHGKITKILDELDPATVMLLLNAVYFRGDWKFPFNPDKTYSGYFSSPKAKEKKVQMMTQVHQFNYYIDKNNEAIELPYKNDSMSALIILPYEGVDIDTVVNSLKTNENYIKQILDNMTPTVVQLNFPKFEVEFKSKLKDVLKRLGMKKAFEPDADFSGINGLGGLYVNNVIHKTYLKVDEFGSEAAAVTVVEILRSAHIPEAIMDVNRPFVLILRSKLLPKNNDFLFVGKVESI